MRGANDGDGKSFLTICLHESVFTGDLITGVFPVWIFKRRLFGDEVILYRLLIRGGRTNENKLIRPAAEETQVALDIRSGIGNEIYDGVEVVIRQQCPEARFLCVDITR